MRWYYRKYGFCQKDVRICNISSIRLPWFYLTSKNMDEFTWNSEKWNRTPLFEMLKSEWKNFSWNHQNGEKYLDILDRFLIQLLSIDILEGPTTDALNQRYLTFMYPNGVNGIKRNPSEITSEEVRQIWLDPETLSAFMWERAIQLAATSARYIEWIMFWGNKPIH